MMERPATIFTLGHSRHSIDRFLELLNGASIDRVVDVRGQPYSRFNPQFNRESLKESLEVAGIRYEWQGERLSGRPRQREFYGADGKVLWDKLQAWPSLAQALDEIAAGASEARTALMCAEENPRQCHRRFLLTQPLLAMGLEVLHIRGSGALQNDTDLPGEPGAETGQLNLFG